jgi:hypothetical protein
VSLVVLSVVVVVPSSEVAPEVLLEEVELRVVLVLVEGAGTRSTRVVVVLVPGTTTVVGAEGAGAVSRLSMTVVEVVDPVATASSLRGLSKK